MSILDQIVASTRKRVARDKDKGGVFTPPPNAAPFRFEKALRQPGFHFICEVKKASPSKGVIAEDFPYLDIARDYEEAGAAAISVLTEPDYFQGSDRYLSEIREVVGLPLLRKEFIIDPFQIAQSASLGADAILLICAVLTQQQLADYIKEADKFGLSCLVEAHDEKEVQQALTAGARVVGVNNRDLKTFSVDMNNSVRLRKLVPDDVVFVSESGIHTAGDVALLRQNGVNAALIGETLMRAPDKKAALNELCGLPQSLTPSVRLACDSSLGEGANV
ncbi:MAG: indole-3-glycerol phosphate synthase TrpC [Oscillospiraceae bacterium]|nr:indole-3-glycerol phosphate synthase TrpC [Oscillospiraceae bacterium]